MSISTKNPAASSDHLLSPHRERPPIPAAIPAAIAAGQPGVAWDFDPHQAPAAPTPSIVDVQQRLIDELARACLPLSPAVREAAEWRGSVLAAVRQARRNLSPPSAYGTTGVWRLVADSDADHGSVAAVIRGCVNALLAAPTELERFDSYALLEAPRRAAEIEAAFQSGR